jgi:hypothetical protein
MTKKFLECHRLWQRGADFGISSVEVDLGLCAPADRHSVGVKVGACLQAVPWQGVLRGDDLS